MRPVIKDILDLIGVVVFFGLVLAFAHFCTAPDSIYYGG